MSTDVQLCACDLTQPTRSHMHVPWHSHGSCTGGRWGQPVSSADVIGEALNTTRQLSIGQVSIGEHFPQYHSIRPSNGATPTSHGGPVNTWATYTSLLEVCVRSSNDSKAIQRAGIFPCISVHVSACQCMSVHVSACQYMSVHVSADSVCMACTGVNFL